MTGRVASARAWVAAAQRRSKPNSWTSEARRGRALGGLKAQEGGEAVEIPLVEGGEAPRAEVGGAGEAHRGGAKQGE